MTVTVDMQVVCEDSVPDKAHFQQWVNAALKEVSEDCELSIRLVGEQESASLNSTYRGKAGPTNVLSFPFESPVAIEPRLLGDLVVCASVVKMEAVEQHKTVNDHWAHMVVHGCLHLLGYDHLKHEEAEQMEALEVTILQILEIDNPYFEKRENK